MIMDKDSIKINGITFTVVPSESRLFFPTIEDCQHLTELNLIRVINGKLTQKQSKRLKEIKDKYRD